MDEDFLELFETLAKEWDDLALKHSGNMYASYSDPARTCQTAARKVREALRQSRPLLEKNSQE